MPNMSYCRFENTYNDLEECFTELQEANSIPELIASKNKYERPYVRRLIGLCMDIAEEFGNVSDEEE